MLPYLIQMNSLGFQILETLPMLSQQLLTREFVNHILMPQSHITLSIYNLEQGVYVLPKVSDILLIDLILS